MYQNYRSITMYSQNQEEAIITKYFESKGVGTFCSIGENDGKTFSNVRRLVELGWKGVMIEPSPKAFEKLKALYEDMRGLYVYDYAICNYNGKAILNESSSLLGRDDVGLVSTFNASEMSRFKSVVSYTPIEVKCYTWKTALNRWKIKQFDFISIDVEGHEMDILPDIDLSFTKMLCIEWNGDENLKREYEIYLQEFRLIYTSGENLIYAR